MFNKFLNFLKKDKRGIEDIPIDEVNMYKKQGAILIDVRSPQEYREGHLNGAINIPDYRIKKEIQNEIYDKSKLIVLYCSNGGRSKKVKNLLDKMGYKNVINI